jgi:6-bladed beta-propeller protein
MKHRTPILLLAVSALGCGAPTPPFDDGVRTISQVIDRDRVLQLTEELRVDGSREDVAFNRINAGVMDQSGNMYVLDAGNTQVVVIGRSGDIVRVIGRAGQGPGEFGRPRQLWVRGDSIGVADSENRVHLFRTDGTHLVTRAYRDFSGDGDFWFLSGMFGTDRGWLVSAGAYFRRGPAGSDTNLPPVQRTRLFRVDWDGGLEETGLYREYAPVGEMVGVFFVQPPFDYSPRTAIDGLGRVHVVETGDYVIDVYDVSGALLHRVENEIDRRPITRSDLTSWKESRACRPGAVECDESRTDLALSMPVAQYHPVVSRMVAFHTGYLAVMRTGTDPDPDDALTMGEYDIFDPDGVFLGRLPVGLSPRWFDGRTLLATVWDDLMVPSMIRYHVELP